MIFGFATGSLIYFGNTWGLYILQVINTEVETLAVL